MNWDDQKNNLQKKADRNSMPLAKVIFSFSYILIQIGQLLQHTKLHIRQIDHFKILLLIVF